ncbi:MAG: hypothetical protein A4E29_01211 [Methanomassiliicoccales archaeon PtaB.Bin134]|nr:MAG: hypothetical protein A4E29_01211 [Methanomassiliicoccales archaeon PtaB.Bin134]
MVRSTGTRGLICEGFPPISCTASRMAARSTTQGTPVKSCNTTLAGMNGISSSSFPAGVQDSSFSTSSAVTSTPSSWRSRDSRSTFTEKGKRSTLASSFFRE